MMSLSSSFHCEAWKTLSRATKSISSWGSFVSRCACRSMNHTDKIRTLDSHLLSNWTMLETLRASCGTRSRILASLGQLDTADATDVQKYFNKPLSWPPTQEVLLTWKNIDLSVRAPRKPQPHQRLVTRVEHRLHGARHPGTDNHHVREEHFMERYRDARTS